MNAERTFRGTSLTKGIAMGRVCLYREDILNAVPEYTVDPEEAKSERERFASAVTATKEELRRIYERVRLKLGPTEAEIFNAHILILEDPAFSGAIERHIGELLSAGSAVRKVVREYEDKFRTLPGEYFRERIQDIHDIARRLVGHLGTKHAGFMCSDCHEKPAVVAAENLTPSLIAGIHNRQVAGIVAEKGSAVSHGAILARALGVPVLINVKGLFEHLGCGTPIVLDAGSGEAFVDPAPATLARYEHRQRELQGAVTKYDRGYAATGDGVKIRFLANAGGLADVGHAKEHGIRDVGLFRTEFLFLDRMEEPSVEEQTDIYRSIIDAVEGTVTFRLLDIGGDKILDFLSLPAQENPSLGLRGARIYEIYPDIIDHQVEALLRAKGDRPLNILIPMISTVKELRDVKERIYRKLETVPSADPGNLKIGCMVEVPSAVYVIQYLAEEADFLSIGTNDLIQYIMGADRTNAHLAELSNPFQPAVIKVLNEIARNIVNLGKEVVVCGEVASDPETARMLVGFGYRNLSINVHSMERIGEALSGSTIDGLESMARELLGMRTLESVIDLFVKRGE